MNTGNIQISYQIQETVIKQGKEVNEVHWYFAECIQPCSSLNSTACTHGSDVYLYSYDLNIRAVYFFGYKASNQVGELPLSVRISGVPLNEDWHRVWHIACPDPLIKGPYVLAIETDTGSYLWHINYLSTQTELFLSENIPSPKNRHFLSLLRQANPTINIQDPEQLKTLIQNLKKCGRFIKLEHFIEFVNQKIDIPLAQMLRPTQEIPAPPVPATQTAAKSSLL